MDRNTILLISLILILTVAAFIRVESFVDASDNSGSKITLSLADIVTLFASTKKTSTSSSDSSNKTYLEKHDELKKLYPRKVPDSSLDQQFYSDLKSQILTDVRDSVRKELQGSPILKKSETSDDSSCGMISDDCINSFVNKQGSDFLKYIPGKNPSDYIRKDSIPCYSCNLA